MDKAWNNLVTNKWTEKFLFYTVMLAAALFTASKIEQA